MTLKSSIISLFKKNDLLVTPQILQGKIGICISSKTPYTLILDSLYT